MHRYSTLKTLLGRGPIVCCLAAIMVAVSLAATPISAQGAPARYRETPLHSWRTNGVANATLVVGNTVYVGGSFHKVVSYNGRSVLVRHNLAAFDVRTGRLLKQFRANTSGPVRSLATDGRKLFVGGDFNNVKGKKRRHVAAVNFRTGALLKWKANTNATVYAMAVGGGRLHLGGGFTKIKGANRTRLAAVTTGKGNLTNWRPSANGRIQALATDNKGSVIYAGGLHSVINGRPSKRLSKITKRGKVVVRDWGIKGSVEALDLSPDGRRLAVGTKGNDGIWFNSKTANRIWLQHCNGNAQAIRIISGSVITGFHDGCDGVDGRDLTINRASDGRRDMSFTPRFDAFFGVQALSGNLDRLVAGGTMSSVNGVRVGGFAIFAAR